MHSCGIFAAEDGHCKAQDQPVFKDLFHFCRPVLKAMMNSLILSSLDVFKERDTSVRS